MDLVIADGSFLSGDPPDFLNVLRDLLEGISGWVLGTGGLGSAAAWIIAVVFWAIGLRKFADDTGKAAKRIWRVTHRGAVWSTEKLTLWTRAFAGARLFVLAFAVAMTVVALSAQVLWLFGARWMGSMLAELWNLVAWGSWEAHDGTYFLVIGILIVIISWLAHAFPERDADVAERLWPGLLAAAAPLVMFAVSALFLVLALVIATLSTLLSFGSATDSWRIVGMYGEFALLFLCYAAAGGVAVNIPMLATRSWRAAFRG